MSHKLNIDSVKLLLSNTLYRWARIVFQVFLNIYLWKETQDIKVIAVFNLAFFWGHLFWFISAAQIVKKWLSLLIHRTVHIVCVISYLIVIFFPNVILDFYIIWWISFGLVNGAYYSNYNVLQFDLTDFNNRWNFEGWKKTLKVLGRSIFPALFWTVIGLYSIDFALLLGIIIFTISLYLWDVASVKRWWKLKYKKFTSLVLKEKKVLLAIVASFFFTAGFSLNLIEVLLPLIMFDIKPSELELGLSLSVLSILSMIFMYLFWRFMKYKYYNYVLPFLALLFVVFLFIVLSTKSYVLVLISGAILSTIMTLYSIPFAVITMNCLHSIKNYHKYRVEYNIYREIAQVSGWLVWFVFMYFSEDLSVTWLQTLLYFMISFAIISTVLLMKIKIHEIKN